MPQRYKILLSIVLLNLLANTTQASDKVLIQKNKHSAVNRLNNLSSDYTFGKAKQIKLDNGQVRYKLGEYFKGVPVLDTTVVSIKENIRRAGDRDVIGGSFIINIEDHVDDPTPKITSDEAIQIALAEHGFKGLANNIVDAKADLYIKHTSFENDSEGVAELAYVVDFFNDDAKPKRPFTIINAHTGKVIKRWEGLTTNYAIGPGGNEKTGKYFYGKDYGYLVVDQNCAMISPNVETYDMRNTKKNTSVFKFSCPENTYKETNGAYAPINDAHYFGNAVYDMYNEWFQIPPLKDKDDNPLKLKMLVHYSTNCKNAFWTGKEMAFGDGGKRMYPLVSADIIGHEVSHGFTEKNSKLIYVDQSGAINESFSDMAGQAIQYFLNKNKPEAERNDWLVGSDIVKAPKGVALRYFEDPTKDGGSIGHVNDYYDGIDVHASSGVFNRAFYLLAHKPGWNTKKAFEIFVLANQLYWTQETNYDQGGCGAKTAAVDLEYNVYDVIDAFKTVGVNATCGVEIPPPPPIPDPLPDPKNDPKVEEQQWTFQQVLNLPIKWLLSKFS